MIDFETLEKQMLTELTDIARASKVGLCHHDFGSKSCVEPIECYSCNCFSDALDDSASHDE